MELAILAGAGVFGYLLNQQERKKYFKSENDTNLNQMIPGNPYPVVYGPNGQPLIMNGGYIPNQQMRQMPSGTAQNVANPNYGLNQMFNGQQQIFQNQYNAQNKAQNRGTTEHFENYPETNGSSMGPIMPIMPIMPMNPSMSPMNSSTMPSTMPSIMPINPSMSPIMPSQRPHDFQNRNVQNGPQGPQGPLTNDYLLDVPNRPMSDFTNNNMVPHARKFTQNMAGTGVAQGNYTQDVTVDSGFDKSNPNQTLLSMYTGLDDTYASKREAGPMFSPAEQQQNWVFGAPLLRPDEERYTVSITERRDLAPVQPIQVGPGLGLDPNIPAAGGFHEFTRVMPNNVSDYKANQLENRVNEGKFVTAGLPQAYPGIGGAMNAKAPGVPKNRAPKDWSQARRPTMTTKVGFVNSTDELRGQWDTDNRPKNGQREQISYGYGSVTPNATMNDSQKSQKGQKGQNSINSNEDGNNGVPCVSFPESIGIAPARPGMNLSNRSPTYMSQDNNIRSKADCNSVPIINVASSVKKTGPMITNYYVNETDRGSVNPSNIEQVGLKGPNLISTYVQNDPLRTTMRETTEFSYNANPAKSGHGSTFYTYDDVFRTTQKETTEFSYQGDASKPGHGSTFYTYNDLPKSTMKETTEFSYQGDANRPGQGSKFYTYKDGVRNTIKQSTNFAYTGDPNKAGKAGKFYSFKDAPKPTIKQSTNFDYTGVANMGKSKFTESSRFQYTGPDTNSKQMQESFQNIDYNDMKSVLAKAVGGADTFTIKGTTLVKNYFPGAGRQNIRQDADDIMGHIDFGTFGSDTNMNGPGTLAQALPNGARFQNNQFLAQPTANPNKLVSMDDRQLASYQNEQLKKNPLSIWTNNRDADIPMFEADNEPDDYADMITVPGKYDEYEPEDSSDFDGPNRGQNVYPPGGSITATSSNNPNMNIVFNEQTENDYNPMISQGSSRGVNQASFSGHGYSGQFDPNVTVQSPSGPVEVYGASGKMVKMQYNDVGMQNGPVMTNEGAAVCEPNPALTYSGGTLMLDRDLL